ncbi:MAG: ATP-binding protein [Candidatus Rokubacteria bacterium]|nr:ATP-binding protein [Candidatus Rokubacteria bacterium]
MSKIPWTPWHKVVHLRDDVRTGELSMAVFAADLYEVAMRRGTRRVYEEPAEFFALTYPTANLRDLARDIVLRLAGRTQKAIRQLELTYGGGKTHTLITLYHLVNDPAALPDLPSVREFREHIGIEPPRARVAVLSFDKLDVEKGMEVRDPAGATRRLRQPWSVLAWQLAGEAGLRMLHAEDRAEERETAPAESLLEPLLREPQRVGLATLVLVDEVLMYAHEKVSHQREWLGRLKNFFQYLCQATVKVDRAAVVASLLATDPSKSDELGKQIVKEIYDIFAREKEEGVQPVLKEDVAEVLRRRFFTPESIASRDAFRPHVFAALQGIVDLDENTRRNRKAAEERFLQSYPFHPDLTEVFYGKWTGMDSFQRTRGALRTFALALRDAEKWDTSPLVGPNVFLSERDRDAISEAARELTSVASKEQTEGTGHNWTAILEGELKKARAVQEELPGLRFREIEQAVFSTFIHSQPIGAKARLDELLILAGATRPDRISLEKGLRFWFDRSWFLDESADAEVKGAPGSAKPLPVSWRLGARPNLRQMHADACARVPDELVEARLLEDIRKLRSLTAGASAAGARVHNLPEKPSDIEDEGDFHYAVLGPPAASESGRPSAEARRFLEENTGPSNPRKERNAVVLAVPSRDGLFAARQAVRDYLGWEGVKDALKDQEVDPIRSAMLASYTEAALKKIPGAVTQAYCIVATISETDEVHAFKVQVGDGPLFQTIKADRRSRIQETAISADAILPGGPYDLWREGEDARRVKDLVGAFARFARLPKMLDRKAILDTIVTGCVEGVFVGRLRRPDRSVRTFWRERPEPEALNDSGFEVVLPEKAELTGIAPSLLYPNAIPDLWTKSDLSIREVHEFLSGTGVIGIDRGGYVENLAVPRTAPAVIDAALGAAVREGKLWLTSGPASLLGEDVPPGLLTEAATVQAPPPAVPPLALLPDQLTPAWSGNRTNALAIWTTLSQKAGKNLPWLTVREAIDGALRVRVIELEPDAGPWPCDATGAARIRLRLASTLPPSSPPPPGPGKPGARTGAADLTPGQIQDLAEVMGDLLKAKAGYELTLHLRVELTGKEAPPEATVAAVNEVLRKVNDDIQVK